MIILHKPLDITSRHYKIILNALAVAASNAKSRLIGGCVRDALLGRDNADIDIATTLEPSKVIDALSKANIKTLPTGIKFGTISAFIANEVFQITTLRKDLNCSGRHAKVEFTTDFELDAKRRDFTINSLSYCPFTNKLYDYCYGLQHLIEHKVYFIGEPETRITEDYLRILRFFRFSCCYADQLDKQGLDCSIKLQAGLKLLSRERIKWEMDKIIDCNHCPLILNEMFKNGILNTIFAIYYFDFDQFEEILKIAKQSNLRFSLAARYALLFRYIPNFDIKILLNFKFTKAVSHQILDIANYLNNQLLAADEGALRKIWLEKHENFIDFILILLAEDKISKQRALEFIAEHQVIKRPMFVVNGNDLYNLGFEAQEIKNNLRFLKDKWIESAFTLTKEQLLDLMIKKDEE